MSELLASVSKEDSARAVSLRYFNLYRIVVASVFAIFGAAFSFQGESPTLYYGLVAAYWGLAIVFALWPADSSRPQGLWLMLQVAADIVALTIFMYLAGGQRSGIPYLMMTTIAGAALVSEGRMVFGFASMATIAVLAEQFIRTLEHEGELAGFPRTGITSLGFFAVALVAQLLARRALVNEALARQRGADLDRQIHVNARIIEDTLDGVVVVDEFGVVTQSNPRATALLGVEPQRGEHVSRVSRELSRRVLAEDAEAASVFIAEASGRQLRMRRVAVGYGHDMVLYLEDLDRVQSQAQQIKLAALGRLTANIAHEIRNPLAAVSQAAELMAEEKRSEMLQRLIRIVRDNAARIDRMVHDVMELGRRDRLTSERLDLGAFLHTFVDELALHTPQAVECIALSVEETPAVCFDRVHLHQIVANLVGNALRYCSGEPGSVSLQLRVLDDERVRLVVKDDGPGIPPEDRGKVFEPFFTSDPKGTGLGLYIARELADANGARLELADSTGGAEFHLIARRAA